MLGKLETQAYGYKKKMANRRKVNMLICKECGEEFYVDNYWSDKRKYCSRTCASRNYNRTRTIDRGTRKCEYCGKEFELTTQKRNSRHCSKKCSAIHTAKKRMKDKEILAYE